MQIYISILNKNIEDIIELVYKIGVTGNRMNVHLACWELDYFTLVDERKKSKRFAVKRVNMINYSKQES